MKKRCYADEAVVALCSGEKDKVHKIFREGLAFYAKLCNEFFNSVPECDRAFVANTMTALMDAYRKHDPDGAALETFINKTFQTIAVVIPGVGGDDEDG